MLPGDSAEQVSNNEEDIQAKAQSKAQSKLKETSISSPLQTENTSSEEKGISDENLTKTFYCPKCRSNLSNDFTSYFAHLKNCDSSDSVSDTSGSEEGCDTRDDVHQMRDNYEDKVINWRNSINSLKHCEQHGITVNVSSSILSPHDIEIISHNTGCNKNNDTGVS